MRDRGGVIVIATVLISIAVNSSISDANAEQFSQLPLCPFSWTAISSAGLAQLGQRNECVESE